MAIPANAVWEIRTTGNDLNGGGYVPGSSGTDYSQQDSPVLSLTDITCSAGSTTIGSATGGFTAAMVGNLIQISSGTNFTAGCYQIVTYTSGNAVILDRSPAASAGSAGVGRVGGALASIGKWAGLKATGNSLWIKSGLYTIDMTLTANTAGARVSSQLSATNGQRCFIKGYYAIRGDNPTIKSGNQPTLRAITSSSNILLNSSGTASSSYIQYLTVDLNNQANVTGISSAYISDCQLINIGSSGVGVNSSTSSGTLVYRTYFHSASKLGTGAGGFNTTCAHNCYAYNLNVGFNCGTTKCIAEACNTGVSQATIHINDMVVNCITGYSSYLTEHYVGCLAINCTIGFSLSQISLGIHSRINGCAAYGCVTDVQNTSIWQEVDCIHLTNDPLVNIAERNYTLNNVTNGGNSCRSAFGDWWTSLPLLATPQNFSDIGAIQMGVTTTDINNIAAAILSNVNNKIVVDDSGNTKINRALLDDDKTAIVSGIFDHITEGTYTFKDIMVLFSSVMLGNSESGGFKDLLNTKFRVTATIDADGNRTVTLRDPD